MNTDERTAMQGSEAEDFPPFEPGEREFDPERTAETWSAVWTEPW